MKKIILLIVFIIASWGIWHLMTPPPEAPGYNERLSGLSKKDMKVEYGALKKRVKTTQAELGSDGKPDTLARTPILRILVDSIFPYWYGTDWDYNGITETPRHGSIACGYFVTTSLRDAGFACKRAVLAQQTAADIIATFCSPGKVTRIGHGDYKRFLGFFKKQKDGIWIVGLDNHVGFVVKDKGKTYAVHSAPYPVDGVQREVLTEAKIFRESKNFFIGGLTSTDKTVQRWANNDWFSMKRLN